MQICTSSAHIKNYIEAKDIVINSGYKHEIQWQLNLANKDFTEKDLLKEAAWVILASGFKTKIVEQFFNFISLCFFDWENADLIVNNKEYCRELALQRFNNYKKIDALINVAIYIKTNGFELVHKNIINDPMSELLKLPYIGNITVWHLMKNLGINVAKPDRHVVRIANNFGYTCIQQFCSEISKLTGDPIAVVDLILWRFATLKRDYLSHFSLIPQIEYAI
jgi:hypothetical protein